MRHLSQDGVYPAGYKKLSRGATPTSVPFPGWVVIPVVQCIGESCAPLVKMGEPMELGQKVGNAEDPSATTYASVSGTMAAVEPCSHPFGRTVPSVVISNNYRDTPVQALESHIIREGLPPNDTPSIIREASIASIGDITFPIDTKAVTAQGRVDVILMNACKCEPYITTDDVLLRNYPERTFRGLAALSAALHPNRRAIAIEDNKSEAVAILHEYLLDQSGMRLAVLFTRYPQGAEEQLIQAVAGRQMPPGYLPFSVDCAAFNAGTVAVVYRAAYEGKPVTKRIVIVVGKGVKEPENPIVRVDTPLAQVTEVAGGLMEDACKVFSGGPMMGTTQGELAAPVPKSISAVLCLTSVNPIPERPVCIRCPRCAEIYPIYLQFLYPYRYEVAGNLDVLQILHVTDCIECGCCPYTCPGQSPLTERFRTVKQVLKEGIRP